MLGVVSPRTNYVGRKAHQSIPASDNVKAQLDTGEL